MSIGGEAEKTDNWLSVARHPHYLNRFMDHLAGLVSEHHYDGFDIDWEPTALTDEDGAAYTSLLKNLRGRFPHAIITTALPASEYWVSHFFLARRHSTTWITSTSWSTATAANGLARPAMRRISIRQVHINPSRDTQLMRGCII